MTERKRSPKTVAILADLPLWTLPGLGHLGPPPGHYATWLEPLVAEFAGENDLRIHWITLSKRVQSAQRHAMFGQTVHILPRGKKCISMATGFLGEVLAIRHLIKEIEPDLVHSWGSEDVYGLAGAFGPVHNRLFTLQGCLTDYLRRLGGGFLFRLQAFYEKPTIRRFRHGTAESPAARDSLLSIQPQMNVRLVDYGVNPEFFEARWNPSTSPAVVFLGGVTKRKGILDLVEVAKAPEMSHITFKVIGDGDLLPALRADSPPNIQWLGKLDRRQVIQHLAEAWCLVMPTYADTGPTVIKEARVMGLPVVTTTGAGASCYIQDGKCGAVVAPGDVGALTRAVALICSFRDTCIALGGTGWDEAREQLHPRATAASFAGIYRELTSELPSHP